MKRSYIIVILGFIILLSASYFITGQVKKTTHALQSQVGKIEILIEEDRWEEAFYEIKNTYQNWVKKEKWLAMVLHQNVLTNIEISFQKLFQFAASEEKGLSLAELNTLIILLTDIHQSDDISLENIL
ncbi:MAG: DUF4363 family protein [Desulfitobacteriia bacterium]|jgi:hypothetical protein